MSQIQYMVRKGVEQLYGPMTLEELKHAIEVMEINLEDEVCGSCNSWVPLEKPVQLKALYPEIYRGIYPQLKSGWTTLQSLNSQKKSSHVNRIFFTWLMIMLIIAMYWLNFT